MLVLTIQSESKSRGGGTPLILSTKLNYQKTKKCGRIIRIASCLMIIVFPFMAKLWSENVCLALDSTYNLFIVNTALCFEIMR